MPHITTCVRCGCAYEEGREEAAGAPGCRLCGDCWPLRLLDELLEHAARCNACREVIGEQLPDDGMCPAGLALRRRWKRAHERANPDHDYTGYAPVLLRGRAS